MKLGLGCGALGDARLDEGQAAALVDAALRVGVKVFDTARSYGESEGRLGRFLHRRAVTISTKGGYGVEPVREWTGAAITAARILFMSVTFRKLDSPPSNREARLKRWTRSVG